MLAGCSSAVLSRRHRLSSDDSVQFQACHFQLQEKHYPSQQKMSTQRFDFPCSFSRKEGPRIARSLEKLAETRGACSFRQNLVTPSSSSVVSQTATWEGRREVEGGGVWERGKSLKRFYEGSSSEDSFTERAKRKRTSSNTQLVGGDEDFWFPQSIDHPPLVEEEQVFFVPNAAIFPPFPSSSNASVGSFRTEMADKGEMDVGTSEGPAYKSDSSSSSDTHGISPKLNENSPRNGAGHMSQIPNPSGVARVTGQDENTQMEHQGFELLSLLIACAESISSRDYEATNYFLSRLGELASPTGTPTHRIVAYFTEALALRVGRLWPHIFSIAPPRELADQIDDDDATALQILNDVSPVPKFLHFTLNERLLRAFEGKDRVHIIDFDIKQGLQWPSLFQSLASRPNPPSHVRITGIGDSKQDLQDTGVRLAGIAEALNLPFEFHTVVDRLEDTRLWMLHVKEQECVAVNCSLQLHKTLYDDNGGAFMDLLGLIRSTNPAIVLVAEEESEHNDPRWEMRFANSLKYYSAIFDSVDYSLPVDSPARIKIEEMFARKIRNIIACEGNERTERHEIFNKWRNLMEDGGFRCVGIGERERLQAHLLLKMYSCENYSVEKQGEGDSSGLTLKWLDQHLYTVSAWAPIEIASSSSIPHPG